MDNPTPAFASSYWRCAWYPRGDKLCLEEALPERCYCARHELMYIAAHGFGTPNPYTAHNWASSLQCWEDEVCEELRQKPAAASQTPSAG